MLTEAAVVGKRCSRCKTFKYFKDFNHSSFLKDGYSCWCKKCNNSNREPVVRKWRLALRYEINLKREHLVNQINDDDVSEVI